MKASHIISQDKTLLDALIQINSLKSPGTVGFICY